MNAGYVLDSSITMAWCFADERTERTHALKQRLKFEAAIVPSLWPLEVVNVLMIAEKRGRISAIDSTDFLARLQELEIRVDDLPAARAFHEIHRLCRTHGLTSYDAAYLELALRFQLPLASLDSRLRTAALAVGVPVLGL